MLAAFTLAACDPNEKPVEFTAENLIQTRWEGTLQTTQGNLVTGTSDITLKFDTAYSGHMIQKRSGAAAKDYYDMTYSVSGKKISFDCPVISGTWEVSGYTDSTMLLTLLPTKNSQMILSLK